MANARRDHFTWVQSVSEIRIKQALLTVVIGLLAASLACADMAPPTGTKAVPVTTVIEATEDFPDYAFFAVSFSFSPGPPPGGGTSTTPTLHFFVPGTTIKATGDWHSGGGMYAVPRTVAERNPYWKGFLASFAKQNPPRHMSISTSDEGWIALGQSVRKGEVPGAESIRFGGSENVPVSDERSAIIEEFRIVRTPAGIAFVKTDPPAPSSPRATDSANGLGSGIPWRWVVAGGASSLALVLGGAWLVWRVARRG